MIRILGNNFNSLNNDCNMRFPSLPSYRYYYFTKQVSVVRGMKKLIIKIPKNISSWNTASSAETRSSYSKIADSYKLSCLCTIHTFKVCKSHVADLVVPIGRQVNRTLWGVSLFSRSIGSSNVSCISLVFVKRKYSGSIKNIGIYREEYECHQVNFVIFESKCIKNGICKEPFLGLHKALLAHSFASLDLLILAGAISPEEWFRQGIELKSRYGADALRGKEGVTMRMRDGEFMYWSNRKGSPYADGSVFKYPEFDRRYDVSHFILNKYLIEFTLANPVSASNTGNPSIIGLHVIILKQMLTVSDCCYESGDFSGKTEYCAHQRIYRNHIEFYSTKE